MGDSAYPAKCRTRISDRIICLTYLSLASLSLLEIDSLPVVFKEMLHKFLPQTRRDTSTLPESVQDYLHAPAPDGELPWRSVGYTVLDIETSGLNHRRDSVLAIGMIDIEEGRVRVDRRWYTLVRPPSESMVGADSIRIHGLLRGDFADAPPPEEALQELLRRIKGRVLIVHVSSIDVLFLDRALRNQFGIKLRGPAIDTARLAGSLMHNEKFLGGYHEEPNDTTLRTLARKAKLPMHGQHNALSDALTTAQLFLTQATRLEQQGKDTFKKLLKVGGCLR